MKQEMRKLSWYIALLYTGGVLFVAGAGVGSGMHYHEAFLTAAQWPYIVGDALVEHIRSLRWR